MKIINPSNGQMIKEFAEDTAADIQKKYERLRQGQRAWARIPLEERIRKVSRFHELLEADSEKFATDLHLEMGKPMQQARNEIKGATQRSNYFFENAQNYLDERLENTQGNTKEILVHEPLGVIGYISAWNYPYLIFSNVGVPALVNGCSVLYKPSEYATLTGTHITENLYKAGIPEDVFQMAAGGGAVGAEILNLPLDGFFFTGSYVTGKKIAEKVAARLVPLGLELGGSDPLYATDDVDVAAVANAAAEGVFYNAGQSCCAVKRIYVHEKIYDDFLPAFLKETKAYIPGETLGPVTRKPHLAFLSELVADAVKKGAKLLTGGKPLEGAGHFFEPTVLTEVDHSMRLMKEETFGPVIGIQKVKGDEEALKLMNDTVYGLTAAVYCKDVERGRKLVEIIDAGTGYVNCCDRVSPYLPWSGRGHSGLGSTLSFHGIYAFTKPRGLHLRS